MDRIAFSKSLGVDPVVLMERYFEQFTGIYDIFSTQQVHIEVEEIYEGQPIPFKVTFDLELSEDDLQKIVSEKEVTLYDHVYTMSGTVESATTVILYLIH